MATEVLRNSHAASQFASHIGWTIGEASDYVFEFKQGETPCLDQVAVFLK